MTASGIEFVTIDANGNLSPDTTSNPNYPVWPHAPGVVQYGISSATAAGPVLAGTNQTPQANNANFKLTCIGAPPNTTGWVLLSGSADVAGWNFLNTQLYIGQAGMVPVAVQSDGSGYAELDLPLTGIPAGVRFYAQFLWTEQGQLPLSASHAIDVTLQ